MLRAAGVLVTRQAERRARDRPNGEPCAATSPRLLRRSGDLAAHHVEVGVNHHLDEPNEVDMCPPTKLSRTLAALPTRKSTSAGR